MNIIECPNIDLIEPFPLSEIRRAFEWLHCYRNLVETDIGPRTADEFEVYASHLLPFVRSWGIIDRDNQLDIPHDAPLIGLVIFEPGTFWNGSLYSATTRRCWKAGFAQEAMAKVVEELFNTAPTLTRLTLATVRKNRAFCHLAKALGFAFEGVARDMVMQGGEPQDVVQFGLTRRDWANPAIELQEG